MTKKIYTFSEVREQIQEEMDLQEESFISNTEYLDYTNLAIDEAEAEIHNMYQDYFLAKSVISLVAGQADYDLPADIYANKIRHIQHRQEAGKLDIYEVRRIPIEKVMFIDETQPNNRDLVYYITNDLANGVKITFLPTPTANNSTDVTMWYIRNAKRVAADTDTIDIPEFIEFIFAFLRVKIAQKEASPLLGDYREALETQRALMRQTLDQMIPDADETISPDMSFYADFDPNDHFGGGGFGGTSF